MPDPTDSSQLKAVCRKSGEFMVRMTEWHDGFQCCAFKRNDFRRHFVTGWLPTEAQAWYELYNMMLKAGELNDPCA